MGTVETLARAVDVGEMVLVKPTSTHAKVTFLLLIAEKTPGRVGEAAQIRTWLASCR